MIIPTEPPHPDWIPPEPRPFRRWLLLLIPVAPVAGWYLPGYISFGIVLFLLVVIRYGYQ